jgi:hypothetical protein
MKKPCASDWQKLEDDLEYSKEEDLYWVPSTKTIYDERSAQHNGLIGMGAVLRSIAK